MELGRHESVVVGICDVGFRIFVNLVKHIKLYIRICAGLWRSKDMWVLFEADTVYLYGKVLM